MWICKLGRKPKEKSEQTAVRQWYAREKKEKKK